MKPRDTFMVGVRLIGVVVAIYLVKSLLHSFFHYRGWSTFVQIALKGASLLCALYAIGGAPLLVRFAFPHQAEQDHAAAPEPKQEYYEPANE